MMVFGFSAEERAKAAAAEGGAEATSLLPAGLASPFAVLSYFAAAASPGPSAAAPAT
jgi:hypothetical protein